LYGEHGEEVVAALIRDPAQHIPVVLKRLKQKNVEWRTQQRQWNLIWRDVHEKNYLKSLDYKVL
jgi:paired amphipathic helix protein Sin3a